MKVTPNLICWVGATLIWLFIPWTSYGPQLEVDILDIGQGDSILIQTPQHHTILIDGGPDEAVIDQLDQVLPFWQRQIDIIIPTHPQADHVTGLAAVLQRFNVNRLLYTPANTNIDSYKSILKQVEQQNIPKEYFLRGDSIKTDDNIYISSLWPTSNSAWQNVKDLNDVAQVCLLKFGYFRALFTADAGANIDRQLSSFGDNQPVDLLKVAHHGSANGMDTHYLQQLHPYLSAISVGADNTYGHPAPSTLKQLQDVGSQIWRTDQDGRITVLINNAGISISAVKRH
jgi:competence protein ComEC